MNEKLKAFLDEKKAAEITLAEKEKNDLLIDLGLFEKVYSGKDEYDREFPYHDDGWYKREVIAISDEEYEELKKYAKPKSEEETKNGVASLLKGLAVVVYIFGFIAPFFFLSSASDDTAFAILMTGWITGFFSGSLLFGFAEVIKLLNDVKNK